ncbi:MAG: hypothetical protein HC786_06885 [Richelia sp. CSU_2_1]|nr:hypothetical protein [Microcoleus sp. SU_5_6]NJL65958.1 hypothetical protein [Microcoleus sp. SM1_3_4]NJR21904.1 hypothetical protein [Richelia sp. CSU_2_1]
MKPRESEALGLGMLALNLIQDRATLAECIQITETGFFEIFGCRLC